MGTILTTINSVNVTKADNCYSDFCNGSGSTTTLNASALVP